ncbi:PREDICTED: ribosome-binding protein 1-like, partial [Priapulus caudatus]|uniref:Ribosome-binding protein 1-like n=1 Tax=Priapulus caudatus TaxID=37621 RepID=A0ABM1EQP3_PRICU
MESIDMSDPQTLTVVMSAGAIVVTAVLVYAFSVFGFRQKTYEEALEEQRRRDELLVAAGNRAPQQPPSKAAKTAKKKQQRKKEKAAAAPPPAEKEKGIAAATLGEHAGEHVDFKTTPEIIDEEEAKPEAAKQRKRKGGEKPRPILVNKEAKVHLTRPEDRPRSNSFVEISPRDEIELKHLQDERRRSRTPSETMPSEDEMVTAAPAPAAAESNTSKGKKQKDNEASKQTADSKVKFVDMKVVGQKVEEIRVIQAAEEEEVVKKVESKKEEAPKEERTSPTKRQRKPREEEIPGGAKVMEVMKMATLTDTEIQVLIEILLNKQQSGDQWTKKSQKTDPISLLKKQVEEKDANLIESQQQLQCFTNKCKEIRQEQVSEKMRYQQMEKQYSEKLIAQRNELQAMKNVMQQAHDKHVQEVGQLQSQIQKQQGQDTRQRVIETLGQDISKLKQEN